MNRFIMTIKITFVAVPMAMQSIFAFVRMFWTHPVGPGDTLQVKLVIRFGPKPEKLGVFSPLFGDVTS